MVYNLISEKAGFKARNITKDKEGMSMIKMSDHTKILQLVLPE